MVHKLTLLSLSFLGGGSSSGALRSPVQEFTDDSCPYFTHVDETLSCAIIYALKNTFDSSLDLARVLVASVCRSLICLTLEM